MYRELIKVKKHNEVYAVILADSGILKELSEYFKFRVPGYQFMPSYKSRMWDGYIRLFNSLTCQLYLGLVKYLKVFAKEREYDIEIDDEIYECEQEVTKEKIDSFIENLSLPHKLRDAQYLALQEAITKGRNLLLSPTASGKSLIIYTLIRWFETEKVLIIVPTIGLVTQMIDDFKSYGFNTKHCHGIYESQSKETDKRIVVSTWQSIYKLPKSWFKQFGVVIGDEAHLYKAESIKKIMQNLETCKYRFGTTGTLDGTQTNKLVLEGLFGPVFQVTTTKKLMDEGHLAKLKIDCLLLKYDVEECKNLRDSTYRDEVKFIIENNKRNSFITNLAVNLENNTMVLFQYVDKHGKILYESIKKKAKGRKVFYVSGETDAESREQVRKITEKERGVIIVASSGVFSTGINIRNLDNIIFVFPSKSRIKTLQSIGRVLRVGDYSNKATLYDIVDDLSYKAYKNFALTHFLERAKIYNSEKFDYKIHKIDFASKKS